MGACLVAQFRAMVSVILTHHNRWVNWTEATDAAERVVRLSRWIYSGGYAHAIALSRHRGPGWLARTAPQTGHPIGTPQDNLGYY